MRYRTLDVRLWGDERFRELSPLKPSGQALFLYLLTNPNTTSIPGLYRAGAAGMAEELGWTTEGFHEAFREIIQQGLVNADFGSRVIFIPNAIKYNKPQSPNVIKSWASHWDEIPECNLKNIAYQKLKDFVYGMDKAFADAFAKAIKKPKHMAMPNQEQEQEQEQENLSSLQEDSAIRADTNDEVSPNCPHDQIIALYHGILPMCRQVRNWHRTRRGYLQARWRENPKHQNLEFWRGFFEYAKQSDFLIGNSERRGDKPPFIADLEWLVRPTNFAKVIEGKYHGRSA
ncbi:MAG: hypothetical protein KIT56_00895 [Gammaproteobacteria bacterium]|nr:hypothetical protein [Gammaproteobacteria bacterium]MCW5582442.1 hypothetical protein [Gammaproteobacteria bacterium]